MNNESAGLTICICNGDPVSCQTLKKAVLFWAKKRPVQFIIYHDPASLLRSLRTYDILFLGIKFGEKYDGPEIARTLRNHGNKAVLIFFHQSP